MDKKMTKLNNEIQTITTQRITLLKRKKKLIKAIVELKKHSNMTPEILEKLRKLHNELL